MSRVAVGAVRVGAQGTILGPFPTLDDTYDVIFDETPVAHIFQAHMLSALPAAQEQRGAGAYSPRAA